MHSLQSLSVVSVPPCEPFPSHTVPQRTQGAIGVIEKMPSLIQGLRAPLQSPFQKDNKAQSMRSPAYPQSKLKPESPPPPTLKIRHLPPVGRISLQLAQVLRDSSPHFDGYTERA